VGVGVGVGAGVGVGVGAGVGVGVGVVTESLQPVLQKLANLFFARRFAMLDAPIPPSLYLLKM
jgi:hypothetical protein